MDLIDRPVAKSYVGQSETPNSSFIRQSYNLLGHAPSRNHMPGGRALPVPRQTNARQDRTRSDPNARS